MAETSLQKSFSSSIKQLSACIDSLDRESRLSDHLGGASRSENSNILLDKALSQVQKTSLVVD